MVRYGVIIGLAFCLISAAFDVYVAFITQSISTLVVIFFIVLQSLQCFLQRAPSVRI